MTSEQNIDYIRREIQSAIDCLDNYIYYKAKNSERRGYCGPEQYNYEDEIYNAVRREIEVKFRKLTLNIIKKSLDEEVYSFKELPENDMLIPLDFIIEEKKTSLRIGFGLKKVGTYIVKTKNASQRLTDFNLEKMIGIQVWESDEITNEIKNDNRIFFDNNIQFSNIYMRDFFKKYIDETTFEYYIDQVKRFYNDVNKKTSIRVIPVLSPMYMPIFLNRVERELLNCNYKDLNYIFIKDFSENDNMEEKRDNIKNSAIRDKDEIIKKYKDEKMYKIMLGDAPFAKTFLTSEWLFYSVDGNGEFDYTSIVTGYLKSVEQLLYYVMQLEIDNNKKVSIKPKYIEKVLEKTNGVLYENNYFKHEGKRLIEIDLNKYSIECHNKKYFKVDKKTGEKSIIKNPWAPFVSGVNDYISDTMGDYLYFYKKQLDIIPPKNKMLIHDIMDCFRNECRNGFFHTHIIDSWDDVKIIRNNAFYIYFLLLGSLSVDITDVCEKAGERNILLEIAIKFRQCITNIKQNALTRYEFNSLPYEIDYVTSIFLKKYLLEEKKIETNLKQGKCIIEGETVCHTWLEIPEGLVIDITRDQYNTVCDDVNYNDLIYVGDKEAFYEKYFEIESISEEDFFVNKTNQYNYDSILYLLNSRLYN